MTTILIATALIVAIYNLLFFHIGFGLGTGIIFLILNFYFLILRDKQNPRNLQMALTSSILSTLFAFLISWRDNGIVLTINFLSALFFLSTSVYFYQDKSAFRFSIPHFLITPFALLGSVLETFFVDKPKIEGQSSEKDTTTYKAVVKGIAIALPIFLILLFLLTQADPIFQKFTGDLLQNLGERVISSAIIFGGLFILALTRVKEKFFPAEEKISEVKRDKPIELIVIVSSIAFLFAAFIIVQFQYLFSGLGERELAQVGIASLTYSEYVRKGFAELLVVSTISISVLLYCLRYLHKLISNQKMVLQILAGLMAIETGLILMSAGQRDILYAMEHGLTRARIFGFDFLFFLAMLLVLFLINIAIKIKKQHFFTAALSIITLSLLLISLINIDGLIAREYRPTVNKEVDFVYLTEISDDAYPSWSDAVLNSVNLIGTIESTSQVTEDQNRQLYDSYRTLNQLNSKVNFLEDKYGSNELINTKYKNNLPEYVKNSRNPQSFVLSQFLAYQYVLENKQLFNQLPALIDKIKHYQDPQIYGSIQQQLANPIH